MDSQRSYSIIVKSTTVTIGKFLMAIIFFSLNIIPLSNRAVAAGEIASPRITPYSSDTQRNDTVDNFPVHFSAAFSAAFSADLPAKSFVDLASSNSYKQSKSLGQCGDVSGLYRTIAQVQGAGFVSPLLGKKKKGKRVIVEGRVTLVRQGHTAFNRKDPQYRGFWLQQEDTFEEYANVSKRASSGIFIFHAKHQVKQGQVIRLLGRVDEYHTLTEIKQIEALRICRDVHSSAAMELPTPIPLKLPVTSLRQLEQLEGMRVQLQQSLVVSDLYGAGYGLGNYGQFAISSTLHFQPTELLSAADILKNPSELTYKEKDYVLVDDGSAQLYPRYIPFPSKRGFSASHSLRIGDTLSSGLTGVLHAYKQHYIIIPDIDLLDNNQSIQGLKIHPATWHKTPYIDQRSNLVVASMNLGNYFNGKPSGNAERYKNKGFPTSRGAKTYQGFKLQREKIVTALLKTKADIIALMELENDGYEKYSAIDDLTRALNQTLKPERHYRYVVPSTQQLIKGKLGHSAISVGLLYRKNTVQLDGDAILLNARSAETLSAHKGHKVRFNDRLNRPSLIQAFDVQGKALIVAVNHFKSKGKRCKTDKHKKTSKSTSAQQRDRLQGHCNRVRKDAAIALAHFLDETFDINKTHVLILGDLNSYRKEDPLLSLYDAGYINVDGLSTQQGRSFSYSFQGYLGNLDHALVNSRLLPKVRSFEAWHINSVEDILLNYSTEENGHEPPAIDHYGKPDEKRSSDHDPLVIGLEL